MGVQAPPRATWGKLRPRAMKKPPSVQAGRGRADGMRDLCPHHLPGEGSAPPRPQFTVCEVGFGCHVCVKDQGDHGWGAAPPPISGPAGADPHSSQSLGGGGLAQLS